MGFNFVESSGRFRINLERALINIDCGSIVFDGPFEVCREKFEDSEEYLVNLNMPHFETYSRENLNEFESKRLYQQILQDVSAGCARLLFKKDNSFELVYNGN